MIFLFFNYFPDGFLSPSTLSRIMATCGFHLALCERLIEIGVRTTFCTFALICACLYEEIGEQMEEIIITEELKARKNESRKHFENCQMELFERKEELLENSENLECWKKDYEIVNTLVENVSAFFGLFLLVFICHDLAIAIYRFEHILRCADKIERFFAFAHHFFRFVVFVSASYHAQLKVSKTGSMIYLPQNEFSMKGFIFLN